MLHGSPQVLRNVAMATNFWLSMGYNFGCKIASDTLFDSIRQFVAGLYAHSHMITDLRNCHQVTRMP